MEEIPDDYIAKARKATGAKPAVAALLVPAHIKQALAKTMLPGGPKVTSIWLGKRGEWCGHCPPNSRIACTFAKHGSSDAALEVCVARLWRQWLTKEGLADDQCPYEGLLALAA